MLGQPLLLTPPLVVGVRFTGRLRAGVTATDLVLRVTEWLRGHGVVGKFVEFCGDGLDSLTLADRATISNMAPEYGATASLFPVDQIVLDYLATTGRPSELIDLVDRYTREQGPVSYTHLDVYKRQIRRGMPSTPKKCMGMKVTLKPMINIQKCHLPRRSLRKRPKILGHQ